LNTFISGCYHKCKAISCDDIQHNSYNTSIDVYYAKWDTYNHLCFHHGGDDGIYIKGVVCPAVSFVVNRIGYCKFFYTAEICKLDFYMFTLCKSKSGAINIYIKEWNLDTCNEATTHFEHDNSKAACNGTCCHAICRKSLRLLFDIK